MKLFYKYIAIAILTTLTFSCEQNDDIEFVSAGVSEPNIISEENASVVINADRLISSDPSFNEAVYTLIWNEADYGEVPTPISYRVESALAGSDFTEPILLGETPDTFLGLTMKELNDAAFSLGLEPGVEGNLALRIISFIGSSSDTEMISKEILLSVTPVDAGEPELYLVGAVQSYYGIGAWTPTAAIPMNYIGDGKTKLFDAFVKIAEGDGDSMGDGFKFIDQAVDWAEVKGNYGLQTTSTFDGNIVNDGGSKNIFAPESGLYYMRVDIDNLTIELVKMDWGVIGDSTPNGWDGETAMTYDFDANSFKISENLVDGQLKFRSSNTGAVVGGGDWAFNVGTSDETTAKDVGDGNFGITTGAYDLELSIDIDGTSTVSGL